MRFVLRRERLHTLRFAALESGAGRAVRARHPELAGVDSMVWVEAPGRSDERVLVRSDAVLRMARYLGGPWRAFAIGRVVPRALRDAAYDLVARHRHRIVAEPAQCYLPPPEVRGRFLENFEGSREQAAGSRAVSGSTVPCP